MNRSALKARARACMAAARPGVLMVCMTYWLIRWVIDWFTAIQIPLTDRGFDLAPLVDGGRAAATLALSLAVSVLVLVLDAGHGYLYPLMVSRGREAGPKALFELAGQPGRFIGLPLLLRLLAGLPLLPAGALAVWSLVRYGPQAAELARALFSFQSAAAPARVEALTGLLFPWPFWALLAAGGVLSLFIRLTYAQAVFVAIDHPELGLLACLRQSRRLMRGRRGQRLALSLSFVPWFLPLLLSAGLLLSDSLLAAIFMGGALLTAVWALAYMNVTLANYYALITGRLRRVRQAGQEAVSGPRVWQTPSQSPEEDNDAEGGSADEAEAERRRLIDEMWKR